MKKTKIKIFLLLWISLITLSAINVRSVNAQGFFVADFGGNKEVIDGWFDTTLVGIDTLGNSASFGTEQITSDGKSFRVILGGYRVNNTIDFGRVALPPEEFGGEVRYGFYKRYNIKFDILVRTLATANDIFENINPVAKYQPFARLYGHPIGARDPYYVLQSENGFTYTDYDFSTTSPNWESKANEDYSATLLIKLEMNPSFDFLDRFDVTTGTYDLNGIWAGFSHVTNLEEIEYSHGLLKNNVTIQTDLGGDSLSETGEISDLVSGGEVTITSQDVSTSLALSRAGYISTTPTTSEKRTSISEPIYNSPLQEFDLFRLDNTGYSFTFDEIISNQNNTRVFFPYDFRLRPATEVFQVRHNFDSVYAYESHTILGNWYLDYADQNLGDQRLAQVGYSVENVFQKQTLVSSVDIVTLFDYEPKLPNQLPLSDSDEYQSGSVFNAVPMQGTGDYTQIEGECKGLLDIACIFDDILGNIGAFIGWIAILAVVIIGSYFLIKFLLGRRSKSRAVEKEVKKQLKQKGR